MAVWDKTVYRRLSTKSSLNHAATLIERSAQTETQTIAQRNKESLSQGLLTVQAIISTLCSRSA